MNNKMIIHIDGASRGNPGPAGIGIVINNSRGNPAKRMYKYIGETTNNIAEYTALIYSLQEAIIGGYREIIIKTDSELLAKQVDGKYKVKAPALRALYEQYLHLRNGFDEFEVELIARKDNQEADRLANMAIDSRFNMGLKCE